MRSANLDNYLAFVFKTIGPIIVELPSSFLSYFETQPILQEAPQNSTNDRGTISLMKFEMRISTF
jgi:hypothetical protein